MTGDCRSAQSAKAVAGPRAILLGGAIYQQPSFGKNHPLSFSRQGAVLEMCRILGWLDGAAYRSCPVADEATLCRVHDADYVAALKMASEQGSATREWREKYRFGTMENPIFQGVFDRAASTVGGAILAAQLAMEGHQVFHPAGGTHHGRPDRASGFCYFNDPVFAVLTFLDAGLNRVLYLDIDAHHGDGVFDFFADDARVACASIHEADRWPHSGTVDEQGRNAMNIPVPQRVTDAEYALIVEKLVQPFIERFSPQAIVITCGADPLHGDPLSHMELSNHALWKVVLDICALDLPTVVLGGGGYNPWTTIRCWAGLWGLLSGRELPERLPSAARAMLAGFESDLIDEDEVEPYWLDRLADCVGTTSVRASVRDVIHAVSENRRLTAA